MGTRSNIIRENTDGTYDCIYCHWDGYPSNNGAILLNHYTDPAKVDALLKLGDLSSLGEEIGEKHDFDKRPENVCNFYGRDRGENGVDMKHLTADELQEYLKDAWTEWVYVFKPDGKWYYTNNPSPTWFKCCGSAQLPEALLTPEAVAA